jgi:hypothetical protein
MRAEIKRACEGEEMVKLLYQRGKKKLNAGKKAAADNRQLSTTNYQLFFYPHSNF